MAYNNKGGSKNALKYFNDLADSQIKSFQDGGGINMITPEMGTMSIGSSNRDDRKKYHTELEENRKRNKLVGKTEEKKVKRDSEGNVKKIKYKRPTIKSGEKIKYDNKISFKKKK